MNGPKVLASFSKTALYAGKSEVSHNTTLNIRNIMIK